MQCNAMQCSAVQFSAVQCSAVQGSAVQCSAVQCSAVQCSAMQCNVMNTYFIRDDVSHGRMYIEWNVIIVNMWWGLGTEHIGGGHMHWTPSKNRIISLACAVVV